MKNLSLSHWQIYNLNLMWNIHDQSVSSVFMLCSIGNKGKGFLSIYIYMYRYLYIISRQEMGKNYMEKTIAYRMVWCFWAVSWNLGVILGKLTFENHLHSKIFQFSRKRMKILWNRWQFLKVACSNITIVGDLRRMWSIICVNSWSISVSDA